MGLMQSFDGISFFCFARDKSSPLPQQHHLSCFTIGSSAEGDVYDSSEPISDFVVVDSPARRKRSEGELLAAMEQVLVLIYSGNVSTISFLLDVYDKDLLARFNNPCTIQLDGALHSLTPLCLAVLCDEAVCLAALLKLDRSLVDVNKASTDGNSPLHAAVLARSLQCFQLLLLDREVDVNLKNSSQRTALHLIIDQCALDMMSIFLGTALHEVDLHLEDAEGCCAVEVLDAVSHSPEAYQKAFAMRSIIIQHTLDIGLMTGRHGAATDN